MTSWVYNNVIGLWYHMGYLFRNGLVCIVRRCKLLNPENISGYHQINKIGEFLQFSSKRKGIRAWNLMMIRKIWRLLWYQNRNNFEKKWKKKGPSSFKGSQLGAFCPQAMVYCYLEFKLRYLKNLKLFSIRIKELFAPIVCENKKGDGLLFCLKAFSWETDLWLTLSDFTVKNSKMGREICIQLKIDQVEMNSGVRQIITIISVI